MALITKEQAAEYIGVDVKTLDYWRWTGKGPSFVKLPKKIMYRKEDIDAYIETLIQTPVADTIAQAG